MTFMQGIIFDSIISFFEMMISLYFAAGIFGNKIKRKRVIPAFILFSVFGAALLTFREYVFLLLPDFVPAVLIFTLYAIVICRARWWAAVSWALVNYLFIGIITISVNYNNILRKYLALSVESEAPFYIPSSILIRIGQLLLSEIILCVWKRFPKSSVVHRGSRKIMIVATISIILLWTLVGKESDSNEEVLYSNSLICLLLLAVNLAFLLFDEVIARERHVEEELRTQNQLIALQMRSQDEVNNMYQSILSLKHDMNNHLHTVSGYMQVGDYERAQEYVREIAGEVSRIKSFHSGNAVVDALIGSKTALAEMNGIRVDVDMAVPSELKIADGDLTVMIGNLYDNAIDANLKFTDVHKRFIHIKILFDSGNLLLMFENAALEEERSGSRDVWFTTKEDSSGHGFGIKNIDRIVQMYDGYCERELKDHVFRCRIRMPGK
ncbi:MAG: GHKL domain-containing protein [Acetatifactor sp.]|nr:GHKL domain-containing protein [Acetatifactor sp.]